MNASRAAPPAAASPAGVRDGIAQAPLPAAGPGAHDGRGGSLAADRDALLRSATLLQGRSSVDIEHNGAVYRLQATRQGKLILTK